MLKQQKGVSRGCFLAQPDEEGALLSRKTGL
jgi:hypothetical protein